MGVGQGHEQALRPEGRVLPQGEEGGAPCALGLQARGDRQAVSALSARNGGPRSGGGARGMAPDPRPPRGAEGAGGGRGPPADPKARAEREDPGGDLTAPETVEALLALREGRYDAITSDM